jgi:hypothetical protein
MSSANIVWCERYKNEKLFGRKKKRASTDLDAI